MSRWSFSFATLGCLSLTLNLVSACGGQSYTMNGSEGGEASGGSSRGGSSHGGSAQGGSGVTAGTANGGTAQAGTSFGGTGQGGFGATGGTSFGDRCSAPPETGQCDAYFQRWYHDPATNQCRQFIWGGCGGNDNNYTSLAACQAACGGQADPKACSAPSDCTIGSVTCCAVCDGPNVSPDQLVAYNKQYATQYLCIGTKTLPPPYPGNSQGAAPIACQPCPAPLPDQSTLKYFVPDCVQGQCVVSDLRKSPLTQCNVSSDCRLRNGTECCEACGGQNYVAVRKDGSFEAAACGGGDVACDACAAVPPPNVIAYCNDTTGHCEAIYEYPAGP